MAPCGILLKLLSEHRKMSLFLAPLRSLIRNDSIEVINPRLAIVMYTLWLTFSNRATSIYLYSSYSLDTKMSTDAGQRHTIKFYYGRIKTG